MRTAYDRPTPEESPAIRSQIAARSCRFDTIVTPPTASALPRAGAVSFGGSCAHPFSADYKTDFICHGWLSHESGPYVSSPRLARGCSRNPRESAEQIFNRAVRSPREFEIQKRRPSGRRTSSLHTRVHAIFIAYACTYDLCSACGCDGGVPSRRFCYPSFPPDNCRCRGCPAHSSGSWRSDRTERISRGW